MIRRSKSELRIVALLALSALLGCGEAPSQGRNGEQRSAASFEQAYSVALDTVYGSRAGVAGVFPRAVRVASGMGGERLFFGVEDDEFEEEVPEGLDRAVANLRWAEFCVGAIPIETHCMSSRGVRLTPVLSVSRIRDTDGRVSVLVQLNGVDSQGDYVEDVLVTLLRQADGTYAVVSVESVGTRG